MVKTLVRIIRDSEGKPVTGLNVYLYRKGEYPTGSYVKAVEDENLPGRYVFTVYNSFMSKYYSIYITGGSNNPYEENIDLGWDWKYSNLTVVGGESSFDLTELTDDYGNDIANDTLPSGVRYEHIITYTNTDRFVYIKSKSDDGKNITVGVSPAGSDDVVSFNLYVYVGGNL